MHIAYTFCYTLAYLFNNVGVPIEKKPTPGDNQFNFKLCRSFVTTSIILRPISKPTPHTFANYSPSKFQCWLCQPKL